MKAHGNYITTITTATRVRHGAAMLLALAALILALVVLWRTNGQSTLPLDRSDSIARRVSDPIIPCRVCRDEWIAARIVQPAAAAPASISTFPRSAVVGASATSRAAGPIASCRVCRDEWIAAQAPILPSTSDFTFDQAQEYARTSGPR